MDIYITVNHKITEVQHSHLPRSTPTVLSLQDEFSQYEANDPFIQHFIVQIDALFISFKVTSTSSFVMSVSDGRGF